MLKLFRKFTVWLFRIAFNLKKNTTIEKGEENGKDKN